MSTAAQAQKETAGPATPAEADVLVIFGITGDLAKVMTFHSLYRLEKRGLLNCPIIGVAGDDWTLDHLREHARASIEGCGESLDHEVFARFAARLSYVSGDFTNEATYERLAAAVGDAASPVFYLEIPPFLFGAVIKQLKDAGLTKTARVVVEKPFGHDLQSARSLAAEIHESIDESQLYRIDHFLGKMGTDELLYLRFANTMIEPIWNRNHIACVEITMAEDFGVEDRGHFYDPVGALRDVVVNHIMQVVALAAMEAPAGADAETLKDAKFSLLRSMPPADPKHYVRGQYDGYLKIDGVAAESTTETYAAMRLDIDNWRWAGRAVVHPHGEEAPCDADGDPRSVPRAAAAGLHGARLPSPPRAEPVRRQARSLHWRAPDHRRPPRRRRWTRGCDARRRVRRSGRGGADAVRGAAARRDARRRHPLHAPGRGRRDVADLPTAAGAARRRSTPTPRARGVPSRQTGWSRDSASGAARGCRHERRESARRDRRQDKSGQTGPGATAGTKRCRRARRCPRRSRRSPTTRFCPTATPAH